MPRKTIPKNSTGVTFIYAIACGEYCKVGMTVDIDTRLATLMCGNPFPMEVYCKHPVNNINAKLCEILAHKKLAAHRHRNEWFLVSPAVAEEAILSAIREKARSRAVTPDEWRMIKDRVDREMAERERMQNRKEEKPRFTPDELRDAANALELP